MSKVFSLKKQLLSLLMMENATTVSNISIKPTHIILNGFDFIFQISLVAVPSKLFLLLGRETLCFVKQFSE